MNTKGLNKGYLVVYEHENDEAGHRIKDDLKGKAEVEEFINSLGSEYTIRIFYGWEFGTKTKTEITRIPNKEG